jgi:hypothetical protein
MYSISSVKVILASEEVRVLVEALSLNGGMIYLVLAAAEVGGSIQGLEWLRGYYVATQGELARAD